MSVLALLIKLRALGVLLTTSPYFTKMREISHIIHLTIRTCKCEKERRAKVERKKEREKREGGFKSTSIHLACRRESLARTSRKEHPGFIYISLQPL